MSKTQILTLMSVFLSGCVDSNTFSSPSNLATSLELKEIESTVFDIEQNFKTLGFEINLSKISIVVTDTIPGDGRCIQEANEKTILLNKTLFKSENLDPHLNQISRLWSVLVHEIGHCYFGRVHEEKNVFPFAGFVFQTINKTKAQNSYLCFNVFSEKWPGTIMDAKGISVVPQSLKQFYLKELVGLLLHPQVEDILQTQDVTLVNEVEVLNSWESTECL